MVLPEKIKGRNKIRDAAICLEWEKWHDSPRPSTETIEDLKKELALKFSLSEIRIYQIVRDNHAYIPIDRGYEKKKRIDWLRRQIAKSDKTNKDTADLQDQLRKEIEGEKPLIDNSKHITYNLEGKDARSLIGAINNRLAQRVAS